MTIVAGIDLSLTSTGLALATVIERNNPLDMDASIETRLVKSAGHRNDSIRDRRERIRRMYREINNWVQDSDLVMIEALFERSKGGSLLDRAGLWWGVVDRLIEREVPVVVAGNTAVKKFATNNGGADKGRMVMAACRMWPDWEPSTAKESQDEADAVVLAGMGLGLLGKAPFPMTDYRREVLKKLEDPGLAASST